MDPVAQFYYFGHEWVLFTIALGWAGWYILKGIILPPKK